MMMMMGVLFLHICQEIIRCDVDMCCLNSVIIHVHECSILLWFFYAVLSQIMNTEHMSTFFPRMDDDDDTFYNLVIIPT